MLIDCATCPVQGEGCPDCVVAFLLDRPPLRIDLDPAERRALNRLAAAGLVPPAHPGSHAARALRRADGDGGDDADDVDDRFDPFDQTG